MIRVALVLLAACGGDSVDAPDDCAAGELHLVHGDTDDRRSVDSHGFVNAIGSSRGMLSIGPPGMPIVRLEFEELAARGDTVPARGCVTLDGEVIGDCAAGSLDGQLRVDDGYWRFELPAIAGCFRARP